MNEPQETIYIAGWEIHPETMRVSRGDDHVKLEPKVMQVLLYLAEKAGEVVSRQELEEHVWKNQIVGYDAISRTIINIRKALNDSSRDPRVIETIPKVGYRFHGPISIQGNPRVANQHLVHIPLYQVFN